MRKIDLICEILPSKPGTPWSEIEAALIKERVTRLFVVAKDTGRLMGALDHKSPGALAVLEVMPDGNGPSGNAVWRPTLPLIVVAPAEMITGQQG